MKLQCKICGISDPEILKYIVNHPKAPAFVGFIANYKKSKRFVNSKKLIELLKVEKKTTNYVAVLVKPTKYDLEKIKNFNFEYYQIYDQTPKEIEIIKKKYNIKIIAAITIENKNDINKYKDYSNIADIILFDSKGYEKSYSFDHKMLNKVPDNITKMLAGNIKVEDDFLKLKKYCSYIDVSGSIESKPGIKDLKKIELFLNKVHNANINI